MEDILLIKEFVYLDMNLKEDVKKGEMTMPKEGWFSLSIHDETIDAWKIIYDKNKEFCKHRGITSFTGFINCIMAGVIEDPKLMKLSIESSLKRGMKEFVSTSSN